MSTISRVFGPQLCNLAAVFTNFDMLYFVMGFISLLDEIQFVFINSHHICIRCVTQFLVSVFENSFPVLLRVLKINCIVDVHHLLFFYGLKVTV